jgi:hypothetical protein
MSLAARHDQASAPRVTQVFAARAQVAQRRSVGLKNENGDPSRVRISAITGLLTTRGLAGARSVDTGVMRQCLGWIG